MSLPRTPRLLLTAAAVYSALPANIYIVYSSTFVYSNVSILLLIAAIVNIDLVLIFTLCMCIEMYSSCYNQIETCVERAADRAAERAVAKHRFKRDDDDDEENHT